MVENKQNLFKKLPAVDRLLKNPVLEEALQGHPRGLVLKAVHLVLEKLREGIQRGNILEADPALRFETVLAESAKQLEILSQPSLKPIINATGVVVHTNLGRSILADRVLKKFKVIAGGYSNLEYDLSRGKRGSRYAHVEDLLLELTGAQAAMVVNNNAAAVFVALETLARGREVIVSRGQLVEIGGAFRIPDVMRKSGALLVEVGTTNRTHLRDYEEAIGPETALLLRVHQSNYQIVGFTKEVPLAELVDLGRASGLPVMDDLGSGCLVDFARHGLAKEPTVQDALGQGADLVTFSGDKLLGGPQAGIMLGKRDIVEAVKKNPLTRAMRIDKLTLLALEETLRIYRNEGEAVRHIPTLRAIFQSYHAMARKAGRLLGLIGPLKTRNFSLDLRDGTSRPGGGALPMVELPSRVLCLIPGQLTSTFMEAWFRSHTPPIIARQEKEQVLLDVRTMQDRELKTVARAVQTLAAVRV